MALEDYLPFDPDGLSTNTAPDLIGLFGLLGVSSWRDVFHDIQAERNPQYERGVRFSTPEEAFFYLYDAGLFGISHITFDDVTNTYGAYIDTDSV